MKKVVLFALPLVVVALVGAYLGTGSILRSAVQKSATRALGGQATLVSATYDPLAGEVLLDGFAVENPRGFADEPFLYVRETRATASIRSLLSERVSIPLLLLEDVTLSLERHDLRDTNYDEVLESIAKLMDSKPSGNGKTYAIDRLRIRDVTVRLRAGIAGIELPSTNATISEIAIDDLGSEELSLPQLTARVVRALLAELVKLGAGRLPEHLKELLDELPS